MLPSGGLPEDVMVDILLRLPVKSLLRLRSICKPWYVLLTGSNFITTHLLGTNADKVLVVSNPVRSWRCGNHFPALTVCGEDEIAYDLPLWTFPFNSSENVRIVGSCNGLVCVQGIINHSPAMVLWNPATRQFRYLEPLGLDGITFLPDSHDYKLLSFQGSFGKEGPGKLSSLVYTLSSDSWRSTEIPPPSSYFCSSAVELNGVFHWPSYLSGKQKIIVSFDLHDELFGQMALPDSCAIGDEIIWKLVVFKGSLSAIVYSKPKEIDNWFEIWVTTKYGVQESWTKLHTIGPFSRVVPVGSWKNGEVIFVDQNESSDKLFSYDPDTQKSAYFKIPRNMGLVCVLNYVESLESIEGGTQRSSRRCSFKTGYSRTQMPYETAGECESPSNVLGWKFAIPGPEHSNILHCRLCRKVFYGGITGLKQHLAHQDRRRFSPCPYVSTVIREEMRMHLTSLSQHNNGDEFDEDFASSTSEIVSSTTEMTIQGQDSLEFERCSDYGKSEPLEPKHSKSVMKALKKKLSTLVVVLTCRCRKPNKHI